MATISRTGISGGGTIQPAHITNIIDALDGTSATTTIVATGSFTGSLVGTLTGTASFATTALSASYASNVPVTASYALSALSSSYAVTATSATAATNATNTAVTNTSTGTGPYYITFVESATGNVGQRVDATGLTYNATTDTITATASFATTALSASYAANVPLTASYALAAMSSSYAVTASYALNAGASSGGGFPYTGSAIISGSLSITGTTNLTGSINVSQADANTLRGRITGGENLLIDLTEVGKSPAVGTFIIPNRQPATPYPGSIYITAGRFYIYDGSNWREIQYAS